MAIAWSRISSKVIAYPPYTNEACRRRCGNWHGRSDAFIPHIGNQRKQEVLGARDAAVTPLAQRRGACITCAWAYFTRHRPSQRKEAHHVPKQTIYEKTRPSQTAPPPQGSRAPRARPPPGATRRRGPPTRFRGLGPPRRPGGRA